MVREFSDDQRSFCTQRKLQGATLAQIHQEYEHWWPMQTWGIVNPPPPSDRCLRLWVAQLNNSHVGVIQRAVLHMKVRAEQCLCANGGYFEGKKQLA